MKLFLRMQSKKGRKKLICNEAQGLFSKIESMNSKMRLLNPCFMINQYSNIFATLIICFVPEFNVRDI